jgi:competence protein ComEA
VRDTNPDDAVNARLWAVLPDSAPAPPPSTGPQSWRDLIPTEPSRYAWDPTADDDAEPTPPAGATAALDGSGAFGTGRFSAFDPGRRGVRALAAVAVLVVVIAALLAWRSRPRVETVAEPPPAVPAANGRAAGQPSDAASGIRPSAAGVVVAVAGKVRRPGLVRLPAGSRVADAVQAAGGTAAGVDVTMLNPARKVVDGELIVVGVPPPPGATAPAAGIGPVATAPGAPVNLNTATLAELDSLPGVGPVLAQRILDTRTAQGGFTAVIDLRKVDGIGDARYEQLKDLVVV